MSIIYIIKLCLLKKLRKEREEYKICYINLIYHFHFTCSLMGLLPPGISFLVHYSLPPTHILCALFLLTNILYYRSNNTILYIYSYSCF